MASSHSVTFKPFENLEKNIKICSNKKNNFGFEMFKNSEIEKKTIYKTDYVDRFNQ